MSVDPFSRVSAERFESLRTDQVGHRVMLFPYLNHAKDLPSPLLGLWISDEYSWRNIETAHYMLDNECGRALNSSGAYLPGSTCVWLGLKVEFNEVSEPHIARLHLPFYMEEEYGKLIADKEKTFIQELEDRFKVAITLS